MDKKTIESLLEVCDEGEKIRLTALFNASITTLKAYQGDASKARLADWRAADEALDAVASAISAKYFPDDKTFPHLMAALEYLLDEGWKVSKSKLYQDAKNGLLKTLDKNRVAESALLAYAYEHLSPSDDGKQAINLKPYIEQEKKLDISIKERKYAREKFEFEKELGKWIPKKDLGLEFAARAGWMDAQLESMVRSKAVEWIQLVGGSTKKEQILVDAILAEKDLVMNDYANMDMAHVLFKKSKG